MSTSRKTPEQRIAESKATIMNIVAWWFIIVFVLSLFPLVVLSLWLADRWWV